MFSVINKMLNKFFRKKINRNLRERLKNHTMSVISSNCNGALILHDLGEQFRSPFVNLYLNPKDFIKYLQYPNYYHAQPLQFEKTGHNYPVAKLGDVCLYFVHYHSEQEAQEKWQQRLARIDWDNVFIMMTARDGFTDEDLYAFDALPYEHKVVFVQKPYPDVKSAFYISGFEQDVQVGDLYEYSGWFGEKYYDQFDYVSWFNQKY
ncbi:exopolysaccharide biosynthesis protein [[Actinobacillus] rossii]|uniref:Exopolysaccharide biosynthesis protein n=1 Tax=[Actinobacillus] rossii TaxID=123820 RepID=A0A380U2W5_9PAST|nr:exopolysaccharide biosynthesis protein [[Actinobacillus] rossii]